MHRFGVSTLPLIGALTACISALAACEGDPGPAVTVTDSAGVRITLSPDSPKTFAEVDPQPVVSIGGADDTGPSQFYQVQGVDLDAQGRLWVTDGQSGELRIFHADGSHWKTRGGRGEGPGEFLRLRSLGPFWGDSVGLADNANGRIAVFDPEGEFVRTGRLSAGDDATPRAFDLFDDGSVLGQVPRVLAASSIQDGQIIADTVRLGRVDLQSGTQQHQALAAGPLWLWTGRSMIPIPFTINASFRVYQESVHLVSGPAFRVKVFEGGGLSEIYGVVRDERAVGQREITENREFTEEFVEEGRRGDHLAALDHPLRPGVLPAYYQLVVASDGNVWAQLYSPAFLAPGIWDVYGADHVWLGRVETPGSFLVTSVTSDRLAGVWRDELGVEHVRVYRYVRSD